MIRSIPKRTITPFISARFKRATRSDPERGAGQQRKNASGDSDRELKKYVDAIWRVYLLDTSIDKRRLMEKAIGYLSGNLEQELSHSLTEARKEYKVMIQQMIGAVQADTGHSENAVHGYLATFLNSIGYTTLGGKRFTRQNISR
jgi:hypothetical protein